MARLWDISQRLRPSIPVWPGEPPFALDRIVEIDEACPVNVSVMTIGVHAGTHADSPLHYSADGAGSDEADLATYLGSCVVIDARHAGVRVEPDDIDWPAIAGAKRVLIRTYEHFPADEWDAGFKAMAPAVIEQLAGQGVRLIGTDAPSLDPQDSKTLAAHQAVLAADMRILEGLVLDDVPPGPYELIALPLRIAGSDASPVRAILRELDR